MLKIASNHCKICAISRCLRTRQNLCAIFAEKRFTIVFVFGIFNRQFGSIAQLGEHLPYKQGVIGSSPIVSTKRICESGSVVERCLAKANVASSNLVSRSSDNEVREQRTEISVERDIREFGCPQSGSFREVAANTQSKTKSGKRTSNPYTDVDLTSFFCWHQW